MITKNITAETKLYDALMDRGTRYSADLMIAIAVYADSIYITDIANAMRPGKTCTEWVFTARSYNNPDHLCTFEFIEMAIDCDTMGELIAFLRSGKEIEQINGLDYYSRNRESKRTFSPFYVPAKYQAPKKWTVASVVKAIMSGAVKYGEYECRYTDDYAFDAANVFFSGRSFDLYAFAKELTESPSGWSVYRSDAKTICIACHTFDFRRLVLV